MKRFLLFQQYDSRTIHSNQNGNQKCLLVLDNGNALRFPRYIRMFFFSTNKNFFQLETESVKLKLSSRYDFILSSCFYVSYQDVISKWTMTFQLITLMEIFWIICTLNE